MIVLGLILLILGLVLGVGILTTIGVILLIVGVVLYVLGSMDRAIGPRRRVGRPSLTGEAAASPRITFRIAPSTRDRAAEIAAQEGKTVSQLAREALEERVAAGERRA